jgi:hypothetical protein
MLASPQPVAAPELQQLEWIKISTWSSRQQQVWLSRPPLSRPWLWPWSVSAEDHNYTNSFGTDLVASNQYKSTWNLACLSLGERVCQRAPDLKHCFWLTCLRRLDTRDHSAFQRSSNSTLENKRTTNCWFPNRFAPLFWDLAHGRERTAFCARIMIRSWERERENCNNKTIHDITTKSNICGKQKKSSMNRLWSIVSLQCIQVDFQQ